MAQYQELVQGICLAQEKSGSSEPNPDRILAEAFKLRYQFEGNSRESTKAFTGRRSRMSAAEKLKEVELDSPVASSQTSPRIRCPSFHSYPATFEELSDRAGSAAKSASSDKTDDTRTKQPWSLGRHVNALSSRFDEDRIYTYVNHHMIIVMNPYRLLQTARFTSIYDEQVVLTYADTANAETVRAPHPFAIAKQSLGRGQSLCLCGGSGKTELAKDLLKYLVLVAQPALSEGSEGNTNDRSPRS
ncbi:uncharacterized protein PITG_22184 [Phytophthora infestans T30-4]|uniref:Myosin motor domain-containing protein n=1 Tax=Phytophthora infestans (strain T30-4) TaxID=403677 RepID=D0RLY8_PHYIT|nr:uncharacterized protein PITG_22184 [Phytophthora infestans T30-4]EEY55475.1 conserved hypothetical protein [Phytophthora infestans T30-4]|eukprot:XP_002909942.1 conserved hypothetical protein [Phytophthora infestans T30-4]